MKKGTAMETDSVDKHHVRINNEASEDDSEGMEVRTTQTDNLSVPKNNNLELSRSSSTSSLASSSQNDDLGKNGNYPEEAISNDSETVPEEVQKLPVRNLPAVNVPEKIILCIDLSEDPNYTPFKLGDGSKYAPLYMIKRVAEIFINCKSLINKNHEFALVVLQSDTVAWLRDFTTDPREITSVLEDVSETQQSDTFDLSTLFDVINDHVTLPKVSEPSASPPPYVVRVILMYGRSHCVPKFVHGQESLNLLLSSEYFTLDALYIHEDPSEMNKCEEIFSVLDDLDDRGFSYILDVSRNTTKLHDSMAKLLGHPLQRPIQKGAYYKLELQEVR
ncbi:BRISC and BRCA1-A complex member 1-like [Periplaneta americana]|uniref:BRISC and BRCA1-A complex member 1-like n=1 Tax=Periplaneta americana TaxID=6978 RepID=UPI0037E88605